MVTSKPEDVNVAPFYDQPAAADRAFTVRGQHARVTGVEALGIDRIELRGLTLTEITSNLPDATRIVHSPIALERQLDDWGSERIFVPSAGGLAVLGWRPRELARLEFGFTVDGTVSDTRPSELTLETPNGALRCTAAAHWSTHFDGKQTRVSFSQPLAPAETFELMLSTEGRFTPDPDLLSRARAGRWHQVILNATALTLDDAAPPAWAAALHHLDGIELAPGQATIIADLPGPEIEAALARVFAALQQPIANQADARALQQLVLQHWLGLEPDPEKERVRTRPVIARLPRAVRVERLPVGDASFDLRWGWSDQLCSVELAPVSGALTPGLIFEPVVEGEVVGVRVDGGAARLDCRCAHGWTRCPVQLVLDHERVVHFEVR